MILVYKQQIKIRLAEIDTPERGQPFGSKAKQALSDLAFGKIATVQVETTDRLYDYFGLSEGQVQPLLSYKVNDAPAYAAYDPNSTWFFDDKRLDELVELLSNAKKVIEQSAEPDQEQPG